jgi:DNA polymerase I-like protein with 3'-5' exonuclease and polymerase domains
MKLKEIFSKKIVAIDTETYDPNLKELGSGYKRKDGYVCGISLAVDSFTEYFPIKHPTGNMDNIDNFLSELRHEMQQYTGILLGANILYDLNWLSTLSIFAPNAIYYDVLCIAALINENHSSYSLENVAQRALGRGKDEAELIAYVVSCGYKAADAKKLLYKLSGDRVRTYAKEDARILLDLIKVQLPEISALGLDKCLNVESRLTKVLFYMAQQGVKVDLNKAEEIKAQLDIEYETTAKKLNYEYGEVNINASASIAKACDKKGISYPKTAHQTKPQPSFVKAWLKENEHIPLFNYINTLRGIKKLKDDFLEKALLERSIDGYIYPQYLQTKSDAGGAGSGRFAAVKPNIQQLPKKANYLAKLIRQAIIPLQKEQLVLSADYSQQEPMLGLNYALRLGLKGSEQALQMFINNPKLSYHDMVKDMLRPYFPTTPDKELRDIAKTINLGKSYGMGAEKMSQRLQLTISDTKKIITQYYKALPFLEKLNKLTILKAEQYGYVRTYLRRRNFDKWCLRYGEGDNSLYDSYEEVKMIHPDKQIVRANTRNALNAICQGTGADMIKIALVECFEQLKIVPYITVHDEIDFSIEYNPSTFKSIYEIMKNAIPLIVPIKIDIDYGQNWGALSNKWSLQNE